MIDTQSLYNSLMQDYRCFYEGMKEPIFYQTLYPNHYDDAFSGDYAEKYGEQEAQRFAERAHYFWGLKYKYALNGERVAQSYEQENNYTYLEKYHDEYLHNLDKLLSRFVNWAVITVPASNASLINGVTYLTREYLNEHGRQLLDFTDRLIRTRSKKVASDIGTRDKESNIKTLAIKDPSDFKRADGIIVIDDLTTSGNTFAAVDQVLHEYGIKNKVINFAFGRSMRPIGQARYDEWLDGKAEWTSQSFKKQGRITGLIYDVDQTLVDSTNRSDEFEHHRDVVFESPLNFTKDNDEEENYIHFLNRFASGNSQVKESLLDGAANVYYPYPGIEHLQRQGIPFALVSSSMEKRCQLLMKTESAQKAIYPLIWDTHFPDRQTSVGHEIYRHYMGRDYDENSGHSVYPSLVRFDNIWGLARKPAEIKEKLAVQWLKGQQKDPDEESRIVGLGNTVEDMIAYHKAGVEAVLALWGMPQSIRAYAKKNWDADYAFATFNDFAKWVLAQQ